MNIPVHKFKNQIAYVDNSPYWTTADYIGWLATDVYDKNGREIFEGDKIKIGGSAVEVVFFDDGYFYTDITHEDLCNFDSDDIEVVGHCAD